MSDPDAIQIEADGDIVISQDLAVTGTLDCGYLTVTDTNEAIAIIGGATGDANKTWIAFYDSNIVRKGYVGDASASDDDIYLASDTGDIRLEPGGGNVLITGAVSATTVDIGSTIAVTGTLDEDNMVSDSAVKICTQQSIKAYADLKAPIASPTFTGIVTAPTIDLTGGQIAFPAGAVPSADPNTIDDYEEGTFTPTMKFGGTDVDMAGTFLGSYVKVGVSFVGNLAITLTNKGTSNGIVTIRNLPFTSGAANASAPMWIDSISFADYPQATINTANTRVTLTEVTNAGVRTSLTDANFVNASRIEMGLAYRLA